MAVGKLPDWAGEGIVVRGRVEIGILEGLRHRRAVLGVIAHLDELGGIDVLVVDIIVGVDLDGHVGREVELAVERARAVAGLHGSRGAELVDPRGAGGGTVQTGLDAVALVLDLREGQVDFGDDASDVEAFDV